MSLGRPISKAGPARRRGRSSLEALGDEADFLRQSISDLEDEHSRGEVDESDFDLLGARYADRLAEVESAISHGKQRSDLDFEASSSSSQSSRPTARVAGMRAKLSNRRLRTVLGIAAACCFIVAATLLAASLAGVRLPGESATGSVSLSSAQQEQETLDRAALLGSQGQAAEAVRLYDEVLQADPDQPDALTYGGWLVRLAGLSAKNQLVLAKGDASVARAVKVAPGYPDGHALLGVILYEDFARPKSAVAQFREALKVGASMSLLESVAPVAAKAFAAAKQPLPARYVTAEKAVAATGS